MTNLEALIQSTAAAAWRAGCDEKDGPTRIQGIIRRFAERAVADAREESLKLACEVVEEWLLFYPLDVFPDPEPPSAHGSKKDQCAAQTLRKVLPGIQAAIRRAFAAAQDDPEVSR